MSSDKVAVEKQTHSLTQNIRGERRVTHRLQAGIYTASASRLQMIWLCFLIFSLAYELPIFQLTSFDRVNPRLFDLATVLGLLLLHPDQPRIKKFPELFKYWTILVCWFIFCALLWALAWLPWAEAGKFSVFYAAKYAQGLFVIYLALRIPLSSSQKGTLHYIVVAAGIFLALYTIPEYLRGDSIRVISGGKVIAYAPGTIFGPLGTTYDHITNWSTLAFSMCLSILVGRRKISSAWVIVILALFVAWPALAAGSRAGLLSVMIIFAGAQYYIPVLRRKIVVLSGVGIFIVAMFSSSMPTINDLRTASRSVDRLIGTEERATNNTILDRIGLAGTGFQGYTLDMYSWQGWRLPVFGGGFYAVPHTRGGQQVYRVGYGIHNGYLFPLEQGGFVALLLFIFFLIVAFKSLRRMKQSRVPEDRMFGLGLWLYFLVLLVRNWFGSPVWQGAGMENYSTLIVLLLCLACQPSHVPIFTNNHSPNRKLRPG